MLISNTYDHLRNHAFIYERHKGWRLSPVYDANPTPTEIKPRILSTSITFDDPTASLDAALSVAKDFRIEAARAKEIVKEMKDNEDKSTFIGWDMVLKKFTLKRFK